MNEHGETSTTYLLNNKNGIKYGSESIAGFREDNSHLRDHDEISKHTNCTDKYFYDKY